MRPRISPALAAIAMLAAGSHAATGGYDGNRRTVEQEREALAVREAGAEARIEAAKAKRRRKAAKRKRNAASARARHG